MTSPTQPATPDPYDCLPESRPAPSPAPAANTVSTRALFPAILSLLRRYSRNALLFALVSAILGGLGSLLIKPYYTASASFVPPSGGLSSGAAAMLSQLGSAGGGLGSSLLGGVKSNADLYSSILKSHTVAQKMVDRFDLRKIYKIEKESLTERELASRTSVVIGTKDGIVTVKVTDSDPVRARDMANYYLEALRETSYGMALSDSSQQRLFFEDRLRREKDALSDAEVALKENEEKSGLVAPAGQMASQLQTIAQLQLQVESQTTRLASLRQDEAEDNPDVQRAKAELDSLHAQIDQLQSGKEGKGTSNFSNAQVPGLTLDYVRLEREVKYHETLFGIIAKQYEAARLSEANDPPLQILDHAVTPDTKAGPHRSVITLVCFLLGLIGFMLWTVIQATRRGELDWSELGK
jgi:tyrosine-protein kinase Etk/Wzc